MASPSLPKPVAANIRLGWKGSPGENALAYVFGGLMTTKKSLIKIDFERKARVTTSPAFNHAPKQTGLS